MDFERKRAESKQMHPRSSGARFLPCMTEGSEHVQSARPGLPQSRSAARVRRPTAFEAGPVSRSKGDSSIKLIVNRSCFAILLVAVLLAGCRSQPESSEPARRDLLQWSGQYGGGSESGTRVLRDTDEWISLWKELGREPPQPVDFSRHIAVAIFAGERRSGGYNLRVVNVRAESGRLLVDYIEEAPAAGAITTQALTSPWVVTVIPRSGLPVVVHKMGSATHAPARN